MMTFFRFFAAWVRMQYAKANGFSIIAAPAVQQARAQHCQACSYQKDGTCTVCRCLILSKTMLNTEKCPKNYWHRVWSRRVTNKGMR